MDEIKRVKLKQVEKPKEKKHLKNLCQDESEFTKLLKEASFEDYYESIKKFTFKSAFFPISMGIAKEIVKQGGNFKSKKDVELNQELLDFAKEVEKVALENLNTKNGIFVRLSTISPKDAVVHQQNFAKNVLEAYNFLLEREKTWKDIKGLETNEDSRRVHAVYIACTSTLKIFTGTEALKLLIESERTIQELSKMVKMGIEEYPMNMVIREFAKFDVEMEFRGFIKTINGVKKMTGLTQYNNFCYFPNLIRLEKEIENLISDFVTQELIPNIKLEHYVIDIVLVEENGKLSPRIVEVNPFGEFAGGGLFVWDEDEDILNGKKPFEFRILKTAPKFPIQTIATSYQKFCYPEKLIKN